MERTKAWVAAGVMFLGLSSATQAALPSFADIPADHWFGVAPGAGVHESGLMIQWNDGKSPDPVLWGFRWVDQAEQENPITHEIYTPATTGLDLLNAVEQGDVRLLVTSATFSWGEGIVGIGYSATPGTPVQYVPGVPGTEDAHTMNPADHYLEFWYSGFWSYNTASAGAADFSESWVGAGDRALSDGSWDQWTPVSLLPTPEPASLGLLACGAIALLARRSRRTIR